MKPLDFAGLDAQARSIWTVPQSELDLLLSAPGEFRDWRDLAACGGTDPEAFFPDLGGEDYRATYARRVCAGCDVRRECLEYALREKIVHGIWGGYTPTTRRKLARRAVAA